MHQTLLERAASSDGQRDFDFDRDGFTVLRKVFDAGQLAALRDLLTRIVGYAELDLEDPFERYYLGHRADQGVLYDLYQRHPEFAEFARNQRILDAVAEVLGEDVFLYENSVVYKPKGKKNGVPFHQDFLSRSNEPRKFIAWMAIDRVTAEGGALKIVPGSHKTGFLPWHDVKGETHHERINEGAIDTSTAVHCTLEPGDVLIFNQLVVHGSDEAHTDSLRLVYRVSYQGFEEIFTPRGAPIAMRGALPEHMAARYPGPHPLSEKKNMLRRAINKVGRKLAAI
ncbi:MAG TPA: phytanoyl-CoA dioxygenase family protein [Novosphingobium sp.]|nr:phytanoyl-CoA dioxygenase family protein [Novosphingobium sp.]